MPTTAQYIKWPCCGFHAVNFGQRTHTKPGFRRSFRDRPQTKRVLSPTGKGIQRQIGTAMPRFNDGNRRTFKGTTRLLQKHGESLRRWQWSALYKWDPATLADFRMQITNASKATCGFHASIPSSACMFEVFRERIIAPGSPTDE